MSNSNLRLQDPDNVLTAKELDEYNEKLSTVLGKMARSSSKGGQPFFFALASTKHHFVKNDIGVEGWETAATDGKIFIWHQKFLKSLDINQLRVVMIHESLHVICDHPRRSEGKDISLWRLAIDYYVNSVIEKEYRDSGKVPNNGEKEKVHPIYNGPLGTPISVAEIKQRMKEYHENPAKVLKEQNKDSKEMRCCVDYSILGKSADDIYNELKEQKDKYPGPQMQCDGVDENGDFIFSDIKGDEHLKLKVSKKEIMRQLLHAAETSRRMRGTIPSAILEELKHLEEPQLTWQDLCRQALSRVKERNGKQNDWTKFRRRALTCGLYMPTKIQFNGRILVCVDTSGSMSHDDLVYCISQLKVIEGRTTAWIVPNDAQPYWDDAIEVRNANDLRKFKARGRGGTCLQPFFEGYRKNMAKHGPFDLIVAFTDGYIDQIDPKFKPHCDVVWVVCNNNKMQVPFGHLAPLRAQRKDSDD